MHLGKVISFQINLESLKTESFYIRFSFRAAVTMNELTCISRKDFNKDIFSQRKVTKKRRNLSLILKFKDGKLICQNGAYPIEDFCQRKLGQGRMTRNIYKCMPPGSNDLVDLIEE